ncbi:Major Facilitator Superfamily protein [Caloramator mitchellensis]|uniref:Major Facilitator Superfamily protein n=1 Tax=Caloramator mitchellensis TaxID=908809 RepID=A0A0R3JT60_CALMK|nr:MFS transporter [Caloramator mitchellensis]KRQ86705.1 Major Facilitator Superfamily protein [Caloramator mitchellensis]
MNRVARFVRHKLIGDLDGNAYVSVLFEPMWAVFGGMIFFYQPLYMKNLGLTEVQMGFLNSLAAALAVITSFVAGPITDRLGRRRTTLIFDLICWSGAMLVWAISQNFWYFLVAVVFNSFNKVSFTSWTCLSIEDTPEDKRVTFFSLIMIINLASGIFAPIAGLLVGKVGVVYAMRLIYGLGFISMTLMFLGRNKLTKETKIGLELMKKHSDISLKEKIKDYKDAMIFFFTNKITFIVFLIMLLTYLQNSFLYFQAVYLKEALGIKESLTSIIPGLSAFVNLVVYFSAMKALTKEGEAKSLFLGLLLNSIGVFIFLFVKPKFYILLAVSTIFMAAGNIITVTFRETLWSNVIGEEERAKIFSAGQGIISLVSIPAGYIAGYLYDVKAIYPFVISFVLYALSFYLSTIVLKINNSKEGI